MKREKEGGEICYTLGCATTNLTVIVSMKYPEARVVCGDTGMLHKKFRKTRRKAEYCR